MQPLRRRTNPIVPSGRLCIVPPAERDDANSVEALARDSDDDARTSRGDARLPSPLDSDSSPARTVAVVTLGVLGLVVSFALGYFIGEMPARPHDENVPPTLGSHRP